MRITHDITTAQSGETAVALGFFDGVHLGHQSVIGTMVSAATQRGLVPTVFTFTTTGSVPTSKNGLTLLQSEPHKQSIMADMGVELLVSPSFDAFKGLSPEEFVSGLLHGVLRARVLVCGDNYHFGKAACADVTRLRELAAVHGIEVIVAPPVTLWGEMISSTRIRTALREGDAELAAAMLGTAFELEGVVLHGKKLGRTIQCPTINQAIPQHYTIPLHGVYLSRVNTPLGLYWGVTSIGTRPTVNGADVNCETYIIGFEGDLYGHTVTVALKRLLRIEQRFESVAELAEQIKRDIEQATTLAAEL